ncbi:hypothetical protein NUW58_g9004 [Xylaria curta]|uniref:Uncharacterized protein n=1 Tax=Xylaria curta TaxID=42375 RepID=A0ACC1N2V1_9PEZI|nr:hypothetical protein NUW58_g9004 [Xylaria curta]
MDPVNILPALERLDDAVDDLDDALQPLVLSMTDVASKLPLLDKAKLYVLMTYSIESMLFSALRLNEVDAKEHPIFKELTRVRQYFDKIKNIECPPQKPEQSLNKEAAIRLSVSRDLHLFIPLSSFVFLHFDFIAIRSDLADNKEINTKLTEMIAKERAKASLRTSKLGEKRKLDVATPEEKSNNDADSKENNNSGGESKDEVEQEVEHEVEPRPKKKKSKKEKGDKTSQDEKQVKPDKKNKNTKNKKSKKSSKA